MEWKPERSPPRGEQSIPLETFLGGMETHSTAGAYGAYRYPLKPSLVEWKQKVELIKPEADIPLKPSLVEWKHGKEAGRIGDPVASLKPSLVEWKLEDFRKPDQADMP